MGDLVILHGETGGYTFFVNGKHTNGITIRWEGGDSASATIEMAPPSTGFAL